MTSFTETKINGAWKVTPLRHRDERGWFQELFKFSEIQKATGSEFIPVQMNVSHSVQGVIRGIHYSIAPSGQAKYVSVMDGQIDDYIIDIRPNSPTFGTWERVQLSSESGESVLLSSNLAHAFQVVSSTAKVCYAVTAEFNPEMEHAINPLCPELDIQWNSSFLPLISPKDQGAPFLSHQLSLSLLPEF